jgi:hypothetical protein
MITLILTLAYLGFAAGVGLATARHCGAEGLRALLWGLLGAFLAPFTVTFLVTWLTLEKL